MTRRGGRASSSPASATTGRSNKEEAATAVLEFKTFRSPDRKTAADAVSAAKEQSSGATTADAVMSYQPLGGEKGAGSNLGLKSKAKGGEGNAKKNSVTFSPVPPPRNSAHGMRTPVRSESGARTNGRSTNLPTLDATDMLSPSNFLLSPSTPRRNQPLTGDESEAAAALASASTRWAPLTPKSPRTPKRDSNGACGDRFMSTPTDFALDYGKPNAAAAAAAAFDSSNVLAWLHSPNSNGLFSPGGLGSMLNTPKAGLPRTPRTPSVSTSFFFSDAAALPLGDMSSSPKSGGEAKSGTGRSNICISPMSSTVRSKNGQTALQSPTRINYRDVFASPAERSSLSLLKSPPPKGGTRPRSGSTGVPKGGNLDAIHMAERDLMEDEDLSVLLQLAHNTPRPTPGARPVAVSSSEGTGAPNPSEMGKSSKDTENLPSLQLPTIGGGQDNGTGKGTKLMRKTSSRDHGDDADEPRPMHAPSSSDVLSLGSRIGINISDTIKKPPKTSGMITTTHPYAPNYHREGPFYPSLHPGMSHGGSMRVVVGGPPPSADGAPPPAHMRGPYVMGGEYQPPYPPPPSHYPYMHSHYGHYPPPPHHGASRQLYPAHPKAKVKTQALKPPAARPTTAKRSAPANGTFKAAPPAKKKRSQSNGPSKKKNRSPQITDPSQRQQAAATIHSVNAASGGKNDKAAALAAAILRGVTMRPSGKWQAQLYFAGKSRYIGVFDSREKAALAYEIAREKLKEEKSQDGAPLSPKQTENAVNAARKAAFEGVNEQLRGGATSGM